MDGTKSTCLDCIIRTQAVKNRPKVLSASKTYIIIKSITSGVFLSIWKLAKVKPLHKSGAKDEQSNYRPISILHTLSKIIGKWGSYETYVVLKSSSTSSTFKSKAKTI